MGIRYEYAVVHNTVFVYWIDSNGQEQQKTLDKMESEQFLRLLNTQDMDQQSRLKRFING